MKHGRRYPAGGYDAEVERFAPAHGARGKIDLNTVKALKAINLRVPTDAPEPVKDLANYALDRAIAVMSGAVSYRQAPSVLKAVTLVREEICGPIARPVDMNIKGGLSLEQMVAQAAEPAEKAPGSPAAPSEEGEEG